MKSRTKHGADHVRIAANDLPFFWHEKLTEIASAAMSTGHSVYEIVLEKGYLTQAELADVLSPENMTRPRYIHKRMDF